MAEASFLPFGYVVLFGFMLVCILFQLRHNRINPRINTTEEGSKDMIFSRSHLLQANATVIAGLFIFLTIQGITVAGIPALIDTHVTNTEIKKYDEIRKDETRDQVVRDETTKRYAETTLDLEKQYIRLNSAYDFRTVQYFFNPIVIVFASLLPFSFSCMLTIGSKNEQDRKFVLGKILTILGFALMGAGVLMFIGFPIVSSG